MSLDRVTLKKKKNYHNNRVTITIIKWNIAANSLKRKRRNATRYHLIISGYTINWILWNGSISGIVESGNYFKSYLNYLRIHISCTGIRNRVYSKLYQVKMEYVAQMHAIRFPLKFWGRQSARGSRQVYSIFDLTINDVNWLIESMIIILSKLSEHELLSGMIKITVN